MALWAIEYKGHEAPNRFVPPEGIIGFQPVASARKFSTPADAETFVASSTVQPEIWEAVKVCEGNQYELTAPCDSQQKLSRPRRSILTRLFRRSI